MKLLYRITCDGYILLDQTLYGGNYDMTECGMTEEINDGMFEGRLEFTIPLYHPNVDKIRQRQSTILVTEIFDNKSKIRFRGRPVSVSPSFNYTLKVSCESDIRFLEDIPDIFSPRTEKSVSYKIGSEKKLQIETMRRIPTGELRPTARIRGEDYLTHEAVAGYDSCQLSRFGENLIYDNNASNIVYRSEVKDEHNLADTGIRVGLNPYDDGNTRYSNYLFQAKDVGKTFSVEWHKPGGNSGVYNLRLKACTYTVDLYYGSGLTRDYTKNKKTVTSVARYLGNINIIAANNSNFNFQGAAVDSDEQDLDFCIVHYSEAPHWFISDGECFWITSPETVIYTVHSSLQGTWDRTVSLRVSRGGGTTVRAMASAMLGSTDKPLDAATPQAMNPENSIRYRYTGTSVTYHQDDCFAYVGSAWTVVGGVSQDDNVVGIVTPQEMDLEQTSVIYRYTGDDETYTQNAVYLFNGSRWVREALNYNSYVPGDRMIFLGRSEIDAEIDISSVNSCYSNLQAALSESGGYAKVREQNGLYFLDLLADSGEKRNDFYVSYGKNILDAKLDFSCDGIATGVYVKGVWKGQETESDGEESGSSKEDPNYELLFRRLMSVEVTRPQDISDPATSYLYMGESIDYTHDKFYAYDETKGFWAEYVPTESSARADQTVDSPLKMTIKTYENENRPYLYHYNGPTVTYTQGCIYYYDGMRWEKDTEADAPSIRDEFELDKETGVIWNAEARNAYGNIVTYLEVDVANIAEHQRMQYMADEGIRELQKLLSALTSFDISVVDPRVIGLAGGTPEIGNYYPVDIPWLGLEYGYQRLTKIDTNILDQATTKLTLGNKAPLLSDYVAEKGTRL